MVELKLELDLELPNKIKTLYEERAIFASKY